MTDFHGDTSCVTHHICDCQKVRLEQAEGEVERLRLALGFYATEAHYDDWHDTGRKTWEQHYGERVRVPVWESTLGEDRGAKARAALDTTTEGGTEW